MKRGKDAHWEFVKHYGNGAIYARCKCGFEYGCWKFKKEHLSTLPDPERLYNYCPQCGAKKTYYYEEVRKIGYPHEKE